MTWLYTMCFIPIGILIKPRLCLFSILELLIFEFGFLGFGILILLQV